MKTRSTRRMIIFGLVALLMITTVAYAALQTTLNINGTIVRESATWDIYFDNVSTPTLTGSASMEKPTLESNANLSFALTLEQPLDRAVFTVDVVNNGTIDAALSSIILSGANTASENNVSYEVTYADGQAINENDILLAGVENKRTLKVTITNTEENSGNNVAWEDVTLDLGLTMIYMQATEVNDPSGNGGMGPIDSSLASYPDLFNNSLTPVVYDATANAGAGAWVIADTTKQWYNYSQQEWANAVILNNGVSTTPNTVLNVETDVKAMYVWIPRYEYKIDGSYAGGSVATPGEIEVKFINRAQSSADSGYRIHPAFIWNDNGDGNITPDEHLAGIWVGKFETTGTEEAPTILPNSKSLNTIATINAQYLTAQVFGEYLINGHGMADSHMMKNSEWGAVAYLSQSKYGKYGNIMYTGAYKEVYKNDSRNAYTGKSSGLPSAIGDVVNGTCSYNDITDRGNGTGACGAGASTTGNIYGVYDMSGGVNEYVMGYLVIANSNYATDPNGYFGWTSSANNSGFTFKPEDKYFDKFTTITAATACDGSVCYGHALSETNKWYNDINQFTTTANPWLLRGGSSSNNTIAGVFNFYPMNGTGTGFAFRSVISAQ